MTDEEIIDTWTTLEPTFASRRRIDTRVNAWLDARDTPLASEWIRLLHIAPFQTLGLLAVSAVAILAASPIFWFARALVAR
jgi:hypothetical protein